MQAINAEIKKRQPWKISIAEDMQSNEWLTKDTGTGGAGFDAQWDAPFVHGIRSAIIPADDPPETCTQFGTPLAMATTVVRLSACLYRIPRRGCEWALARSRGNLGRAMQAATSRGSARHWALSLFSRRRGFR